ncbi:type II toxin-antitoxin system PemK/MazF family toxin [Rossellomorea vietnamensis]|uniref:type II toxin-antitoxin system PemK/MazF family toxin n=1 Tax=Rossellomorea vietnamensis TaxID=218284 RepID=UPI003CEFAF52
MKRKNYLDLIEQCKDNNTCGQDMSKRVPNFINDAGDVAFNLLTHIGDNFDQCDGSEWLLGFDMLTKDITTTYVGSYKHAFIERGRIIEFDTFGDIGTEQKKKRPAIVLSPNGNKGAIIAPIGKAAFSSGKPYHVRLSKNIADLGSLKFDCGIKLEQIRYIDKSRISGKFGRVSNTVKLNEIDEKLTRNLSRNYYNNHQQLINENTRLNNEVFTLSKEVSDQETEVIKLKRKLAILENELSIKNQDNIS